MKRTAGAWVVLAALGGCVSAERGPSPGCGPGGCGGGPPSVPGVQGPWGQPVPMVAPYSAVGSPGTTAARAMMAQSVPMDMVQAYDSRMPGMSSGIVQASAATVPGSPSGIVPAAGPPQACPPGGCPPNLMAPPGAITPPGVPYAPGLTPPMGKGPPGAVAALGALTGGVPGRFPTQRTEVRFSNPAGMKVSWYAPGPDGKPGFSSNQLEVPGRYNFSQAAIYRLKLGDIPNRPGLELYPTLEVVPSNAKTDPFLAHSAVPITFTEEDFEQVAAGNYVVKVIYLPDPQFQDIAATGPDEVVSSRLEPGVDPIAEAFRRGSILLVVRLGNIDLEAPNTPAMDAPNPYMAKPAAPPAAFAPPGPGAGMGPGMPRPGPMVPYGAMGAGNPMMMGPNGPMMMGPNGPMMMGPQGPMMGYPGMQPNPMLPPTNPGQPPGPAQTGAAPQPAASRGSVTKQVVHHEPPAPRWPSDTNSSLPDEYPSEAMSPKPPVQKKAAPQRTWRFGR